MTQAVPPTPSGRGQVSLVAGLGSSAGRWRPHSPPTAPVCTPHVPHRRPATRCRRRHARTQDEPTGRRTTDPVGRQDDANHSHRAHARHPRRRHCSMPHRGPLPQRGAGSGDTKSIGGPALRAQRTPPHPQRWNHPRPSDLSLYGVPGMPFWDARQGVAVSSQDEVEEFAALLRRLKARTDRSYAALAQRLNMNASTLHRYCAGTPCRSASHPWNGSPRCARPVRPNGSSCTGGGSWQWRHDNGPGRRPGPRRKPQEPPRRAARAPWPTGRPNSCPGGRRLRFRGGGRLRARSRARPPARSPGDPLGEPPRLVARARRSVAPRLAKALVQTPRRGHRGCRDRADRHPGQPVRPAVRALLGHRRRPGVRHDDRRRTARLPDTVRTRLHHARPVARYGVAEGTRRGRPLVEPVHEPRPRALQPRPFPPSRPSPGP